MGALSKIKSWFGGELSWRGPFSGRGELGGMHQIGSLDTGWQQNLTPQGCGNVRTIPMAFAAVMANARAVSQCYANHRRILDNGKHEIIRTSPAARILKYPNSYETWNLFISNMAAEMQFEGESFAVAIRDERQAITALHKFPRNSCSPYIADDGEIFYSVGANPMRPMDQNYMVPARDVLHLRNDCPRHPLIGESPIKAAALSAGVNVALSTSQAAFFTQMSRPSGIITTNEILNKEQMDILRAAWKEQSAGMSTGGIPILGGGMKFNPMGISSTDAQLIESQKYSAADIARVIGVPLPVVGELENSTMNNVEQLISLWLSVSLGALLENIEQSLNKLFKFGMDDYVELDTAALLRSDFSERVNGLVKGVQGGVFTPNEARAKEGLHPVPHGDVAYLQAQMQEIGTKLSSDSVVSSGGTPAPSDEVDPEAKALHPDVIKAVFSQAIH